MSLEEKTPQAYLPSDHTGNLIPDAVQRLSEKLSEMMGEDINKSFNQRRNDKGELVNEEGLPIIDITEPLAIAASRGTGNALLAEEEHLPPISAFPPPVRERWRRKRDSILDQLEEEERREQERENQDDYEQRQEILQKRKEAATGEKERLKAAKEMQKKMGRALLRNMAEARAQEEVDAAKTDPNKEQSKAQKGSTPKKTVAFAGIPESSDSEDAKESTELRHTLDWGDITPARLRSTPGPSLLSSEKLPMKMTVVERTPKAPVSPMIMPDSDDESDPDLSDIRDDIHSNSAEEENPTFEPEEFDMDFAQHQREIALQYHEKRNRIGETALTAMSSHSHEDDGNVRVDTSLDMPVSKQEKPSISRFKATRFASSYGATTSSPSTSFGAAVVPAATARTLQNAIRTGKLDANERLVGPDSDSGSENENENMQEVLDLLKKGELYNLGPDGNRIHTIPPSSEGIHTGPTSSQMQLPTPSTSSTLPFTELPPINRPKSSKFKLSRANAGRPPAIQPLLPPSSNISTRSNTPISVVERSSPKLPSAVTPSVLEGLAPSTLVTGSHLATSMIVDSPSFPASSSSTVSSPKSNSAPSSSTFSMIVDSPSFAKPAAVRQARINRPPTVMSSSVQESPHQSTVTNNAAARTKPEKISRFMAERL